MQQLIAAIKEKGPGAAVDMADVGQRESFDTIGARARHPAQRPPLLATCAPTCRGLCLCWQEACQCWPGPVLSVAPAQAESAAVRRVL